MIAENYIPIKYSLYIIGITIIITIITTIIYIIYRRKINDTM